MQVNVDFLFPIEFLKCILTLVKRKLTSHNMAVKWKHTLVCERVRIHTCFSLSLFLFLSLILSSFLSVCMCACVVRARVQENTISDKTSKKR